MLLDNDYKICLLFLPYMYNSNNNNIIVIKKNAMKKIGCLQNKNQSVLRIIKNVLIYKKIISLFFAIFSFVFSALLHLLSLGYVFLFSCWFCLWFSFCFYTHIHINSLLQTRQVKLMYLIFVFLWFFSIVFF